MRIRRGIFFDGFCAQSVAAEVRSVNVRHRALALVRSAKEWNIRKDFFTRDPKTSALDANK
jgi:hypothetical protein